MSSANVDSMFNDLIAQTRRAVDALGPSQQQVDEAPEVVGSAYDERINVWMKAGKVTRVELQSPVRKLDLPEVGDHLVSAINAALEANLAAMTATLDEQPDFESLSRSLQAVQVESVRQVEKYTQGMYEMLNTAKELGNG